MLLENIAVVVVTVINHVKLLSVVLNMVKLNIVLSCKDFPCKEYQYIDEYDSFITHRRQKSDLEKAKSIGVERYTLEQKEKAQILSFLLSNYNDGRRKNFFCVAVNLLELSELQEVIKQLQSDKELLSFPIKEQSLYVVEKLQNIADKRM